MNLKQCLAEASSPLMVFVPRGETAGTKITLRVYEAAAGYRLATNIRKPKSLLADDTLTEVAGVTEDITLDALVGDDSVAEMVSSEGDTVYVDASLAFDIVGTQIKHPVTGNTVILTYAGDEEEDMSSEEEDTSEEDTSGEEEDTSEEDMSSEDMSEEDMSEEDTSEEDTSEEDMSGEDDILDDTSEEDEPSEEEGKCKTKAGVAEEDDMSEEDMPEDEEIEEPTGDETLEVSALDLVDPSKGIRLVTTSRDGTEFAVFCGENHVGSIHRNNAGETASSLFGDAQKLFSAFKPAFTQAVTTGEFASLDSFGFKPVSYSVKVSNLVDRYIDRAIAASADKATVDIASAVERNKQIVVLASLGLFKGAFDKKLTFVSELASTLSAAGVANAEATVRQTLANGAETLVRTIFEQANELASNSDEYLSGLRDSIKKAKFSTTAAPTSTGAVTTMYTRGETASVSGVIAPVTEKHRDTNRYASLFRGIGRHR